MSSPGWLLLGDPPEALESGMEGVMPVGYVKRNIQDCLETVHLRARCLHLRGVP